MTDNQLSGEVEDQRSSSSLSEAKVRERRYREDVPYFLPKDLEEIDRLDFQHYALRASLQGNYILDR